MAQPRLTSEAVSKDALARHEATSEGARERTRANILHPGSSRNHRITAPNARATARGLGHCARAGVPVVSTLFGHSRREDKIHPVGSYGIHVETYPKLVFLFLLWGPRRQRCSTAVSQQTCVMWSKQLDIIA